MHNILLNQSGGKLGIGMGNGSSQGHITAIYERMSLSILYIGTGPCIGDSSTADQLMAFRSHVSTFQVQRSCGNKSLCLASVCQRSAN